MHSVCSFIYCLLAQQDCLLSVMWPLDVADESALLASLLRDLCEMAWEQVEIEIEQTREIKKGILNLKF